MQQLIRILAALCLLTLASVLISCQKEPDNNRGIRIDKLQGNLQKGLYANGTSVVLFDLNSTLNQTGTTYISRIENNTGVFEYYDLYLSSGYGLFSAEGYYFNELSGQISGAPLTLYTLDEIKEGTTVDVNILTHLTNYRISYLYDKGLTFTKARDSANREILSVFGFNYDGALNENERDSSDIKEWDAILLALNAILQYDNNPGDLTDLLADITADIKPDGKIDDINIISELRRGAIKLDTAVISANLENRYQELRIGSSVPRYEKFINEFLAFTGVKPEVITLPATNINSRSATLNGVVNANDLSSTVTFEYGTTLSYDKTVSAAESPVSGHSKKPVSVDITGLEPGALYHFRVKASNSKGTEYGTDQTFRISNNPQIDQSFDVLESLNLGCNINEGAKYVGQTFTAGRDGFLTAVSVHIRSKRSMNPLMGFGFYNLKISIYNTENGFPKNELTAVILSEDESTIDKTIFLPVPVEQKKGDMFAIIASYPDGPAIGPNQFLGNWHGSTTAPYPYGKIVALYANTWINSYTGSGATLFFRTYVE